MENFLEAKIYTSMLNKSIKMLSFQHFSDTGLETEEIVFNPNCKIKIVTGCSGGGFGFSPLMIYEIEIKEEGVETKNFRERSLYEKTTPIRDFVVKNEDVLFKLVSKID